MLTASVVLPIEGRPATITRSPARRPPVILSKSVNPVGRPRSESGFDMHSSIWSMTAGSMRAHGTRALAAAEPGLRDLEDLLLGLVDQLARGLAFVVEHGAGDLGAGVISWRSSERSRTMSA